MSTAIGNGKKLIEGGKVMKRRVLNRCCDRGGNDVHVAPRFSTLTWVMITAAGVLVCSSYAAAQSCPMSEVTDQVNLDVDGLGGLEVTAIQPVAQTFTVGTTGLLTRIEMPLKQNRDVPVEVLVFDLVTTDGAGSPTTTQLAHVILQPSAILPTFGVVSVDLTSFGVSVSVGDVLAIVLSSNVDPSTGTYGWDGDISGSYPRGATFIFGAENLRDMAFRTFVCRDDAIPTVSAWGLIVLALLLLAGAKVYFNRRRAVHA